MYSPCEKFQLEFILARARATLQTKTLQALSTVLNQLKIIMQFILVDCVVWIEATRQQKRRQRRWWWRRRPTIQFKNDMKHYTQQQCTASRNVARVLRLPICVCVDVCLYEPEKKKIKNKPVEHIVHESSSFCCTYRSWWCCCRWRMCIKQIAVSASFLLSVTAYTFTSICRSH